MTIHRTWHTLIILTIANFRSLFRVCLISYTYRSELQKASGITPWKKCYSLLRWPCLLQDVLNRRLLFKTNRQRVAPREPSPIISSFLELGRKKTVDAAKICGGAENVVKTETQQTFVNGLLGFITLSIYTPLGAMCIAHPIIAWVAHRYGNSILLLINILLGSFQLFCIVISLSEGEIIPFSGVCQSGSIIHAGAWWLHTDWPISLMCNRRRPAATSSRRASFSALASANSFVYFASSAATSGTSCQ